MIIGVRTKFDAAHYLPGYLGKCSQMHGHTWTVEVEVFGEINYNTGMVIDFVDLKAILNSIIERLDHKVLNEILPSRITENGIYPCIPTCENVALYIRNALVKSSVPVDSVKVQEGDGGYCIVRSLRKET